MVREGRVAQCAAPEELYRRPADPWVASFVGDAVFLPGDAEQDTVRTALGSIPLGAAPQGLTSGTVLLRPEQLQVTAAGTAAAKGTVTDVRFLGHDALLAVSVDGLDESLTVRAPGPIPARPGPASGSASRSRERRHCTRRGDGTACRCRRGRRCCPCRGDAGACVTSDESRRDRRALPPPGVGAPPSTARDDALFGLCDASLCTEGPVRTPVDLALAPEAAADTASFTGNNGADR
ncbi:TOBE domain-containing protein [Streptomyces candidus]|uniref:Transport-associated OB type 2 domain-containing protein n=1 Tax=Streptomyces candidus TaxID=67283 RepID=A0A7X0LPR6_9ACTN|nr:TOBE domain-containing protein [Streptomyces candidus]MBB6436798.1 hypothetical protein [Streptomyces candidus]GHH51446.1 hypothetical protein GCM10018773_50090 [Streptomyces candidus]